MRTSAVASAAMLTHPTAVSTATATRIGQFVSIASCFQRLFIVPVADRHRSVIANRALASLLPTAYQLPSPSYNTAPIARDAPPPGVPSANLSPAFNRA